MVRCIGQLLQLKLASAKSAECAAAPAGVPPCHKSLLFPLGKNSKVD
jgi:hypothetical protein